MSSILSGCPIPLVFRQTMLSLVNEYQYLIITMAIITKFHHQHKDHHHDHYNLFDHSYNTSLSPSPPSPSSPTTKQPLFLFYTPWSLSPASLLFIINIYITCTIENNLITPVIIITINTHHLCKNHGHYNLYNLYYHYLRVCNVKHQMYDCNLTVRKFEELTKLCLSSLTQKIIRYYTFKVVAGRKKQSMKTESATLAVQIETTCHEEKESRDRPWTFFLVFCCSSNVPVRWFRLHRFAFGVRPSFSELNMKLGPHLWDIFTLSWLDFTRVFTPLCFRSNSHSNRFVLLFSPGVWGRTYPFPVVQLLRRRFGASDFLKSFLITLVIHPWLAALQQVLWSDSPEASRPFRRLCVYFFLLFFSLSPSSEIYLPSISNFDSSYPVTIFFYTLLVFTEVWATFSIIGSQILFGILADFSSVVILMVSILPRISSHFSSFLDCSKGSNYDWHQRYLLHLLLHFDLWQAGLCWSQNRISSYV